MFGSVVSENSDDLKLIKCEWNYVEVTTHILFKCIK